MRFLYTLEIIVLDFQIMGLNIYTGNYTGRDLRGTHRLFWRSGAEANHIHVEAAFLKHGVYPWEGGGGLARLRSGHIQLEGLLRKRAH